MLQSPEVINLPAALRDVLSSLMTGTTFTEEVLREDCLPLLLMQRDHAVTAFAVGDEADYDPLYEAFKKHYLKRTPEWSAKDVSFVFCLPAKTDVQESFRSRVEVDVYFCRKYVIHLDDDLAGSLARLPFLPLSPVVAGGQARPPSAQTLLRQRSLKAELAKALVVPATSSANSIFNACMEGVYGAPERIALASAEPSRNAIAEERVQATLKSISIQNFRAYRTKKEFKLGSAVTVLYGPNGFGKTSFFDAIDFVVTGGVGRLAKASAGLAKTIKHLESDLDSTEVSLTLERDGEEHTITRDLLDHNNARVNGKTTSRKDVLSLLTGGTSASADRVDNMVALFRATHLFSQESQELTRDVAEKCELPSDIVSRMLAFEDYVNGVKKAEEVLKLARQALSEARKIAQNARGTINAERVELTRLEGLASAATSSDVINARFIELQQAILASGFKLDGINVRDTRALRSMLESSATQAASLRATVAKALENCAALKTLRAQAEPVRMRLDESKAVVGKTETAANAAQERLGLLMSELAQFQAQELSTKNERDWFEWAISAHPEYIQLITQTQALTDSVSTLNQSFNTQREKQSKALGASQDAAAKLKSLEAVQITARDAVSRVQRVKEEANRWMQAATKLEATLALATRLGDALEANRLCLSDAQKNVAAQELLISRIDRELTSVRAADTGLQRLIAELRAHIDSATCLLCGHDHGSQDALIAAIDRRMKQSDYAAQLSDTLVSERTKLLEQVAARQALADELVQEELKLKQTLSERDELERQRTSYISAVNSIGLSPTTDITEQLLLASKKVLEDEAAAAQAVSDARRSLMVADAALVAAQDSYQTLDRERQASTVLLDQTRDRLNELLEEANRGAINLAAGLSGLEAQLKETEARLVQASLSVSNASISLDAHKAVHASAKTALAAARANHQQAAQILNAHTTNTQSLLAELIAAGFDAEVSDEQLHRIIQEETTRETTALRFRDRVADLEVAVDTAATSAAFQVMRERISVNEKILEQAEERSKKVEPWVDYFEDVTKLLGGQQAVATEHFIKQYGARTAVIQQRLRPVYGFGEIEVSSKDSGIDIRVRRKDQQLRPTDYFSQSQVQTLVLGLFLTACSSQTWSGFSSIMMDDPVTHFDDLNTYALLDLILGLQTSPEGERQFVISTCDEKMLQLARQKFRHLGNAAKFYRFSAIGAEGPMVTQIPT